MATKSKTDLLSDIQTVLASLSNITAAKHRVLASNFVDSWEDFIMSYNSMQIAALTGMAERVIVYNTEDKDYEFYDGTRFVKLAHPKYKIYHAMITQSGTSNPTVQVFENNIGTITWTRDSTGVYIGTSVGLFTVNKTQVWVQPSKPGYETIIAQALDTDEIYLRVFSSGNLDDDGLANTPLKIMVFY